MSTPPSREIHRITMFKIPNPEDQTSILEQYRELFRTAKRDSAPYILSLSAMQLSEDARSQDYTLATKTIFKDLEDMKYYDTECAAHKALKSVVAGKRVGDVLTVWGKEEVRRAL